MEQFSYGYIPDQRDARDFILKAAAPVAERTVMYEGEMLPIRDQGQEGTCVAHAAGAVKEYYDSVQRGIKTSFSPRYLYYHCKQVDGIPNEEGTYPRTAMQILQVYGIGLEKDWPYVANQKMLPNDMKSVELHAQPQQIVSYARLYSVSDMIASLILHGPFLIGVEVTQGFYTDECVRTGIIDARYDKPLGGHALCVVGYDADKQMFRIRNSWGTGYGDHGHNWMTKDWMARHCIDAWSLVDNTEIDAGLTIIKPKEKMNGFFTCSKTLPRKLWAVVTSYFNHR